MNLFFKVIAIFFLIVFLLKLLNPKVFPFIKKGIDKIFNFFVYTFKLLFESSLYTISLLFTRTIYVIGLDLIYALLINIAITTYVYPDILDFNIWFSLIKHNMIDVYVLSFFTCTYLIGLYNFFKVKNNIKTNIFDYFENQFKSRFKRGKYIYDETSNEYTYHE